MEIILYCLVFVDDTKRLFNERCIQEKATAMVWPRFKEGRGGYHQGDDNYAGAGKEKMGGPRKDG